MSFGFGISDFEYLGNLIFRVRNFVKSVADAPKDFDALRAEADCLQVCLKVITYTECKRILRKVSPEQAEDLRTIMYGCQTNMEELIGFVTKCQKIAIDSSGGKPKHKSITEWFRIAKGMGKNLWAKLTFVWKEKQPMREKLAIPTQSLNIYLVSLTYVSLSYNQRLSGGPGGQSSIPPRWADSWDLVGQKVAFKQPYFAYSDLMKPGTEDKIVEAALRIVQSGKGGQQGKGKRLGGSNEMPKKSGRKPSLGNGITTDPDGMYLVRPKNPARPKSQAVSSLEIGKADYDSESDSTSNLTGIDPIYLARHTSHSPPRLSARDASPAYEERMPHQRHSARYNSFDERPENKTHAPYDEQDEEEQIRAAERRGYATAREQIKKERKKAVGEMAEGIAEDIRASHDSGRQRLSSEITEPDIRTYMEVMYGVIIDRASPEVERMNNSRTSAYASRARMSEKLKESEARTKRYEDIPDSDVFSDVDSEPEIILGLGEESRRKEEVRIKINSFAIPRREYTPRTEGFEGRQTSSMADRDREHSLREREESLRDRESSLREREMALRERERRFLARQDPTRYGDVLSSDPGDGIPPIIFERGQPDRTASGRRPDPGDGEYHAGSENLRRRAAWPSTASVRSDREIIIRRKDDDDDDDESMYGPPRRDYRVDETRSRLTRRFNGSDDDDASFVVDQRRR